MKTISVLEILEKTANEVPNKLAVTDEKQQFTYKHLLEQSQILGYALHKKIGKTKCPIMLFMEKSCECIAAMFGILYSGNIYVPMDIKTPIDRVNSILSTLESSYVLATLEEKEILTKIGYIGEVFVYEDLIEEYRCSYQYLEIETIKNSLIDTDLMYLLFTSGSTGVPKGVAVMYRSVIDYIDALTNEIGIDRTDVVGNQTPFYADMSLKDIYMTISVGATICIIPQKLFMSPKNLLQYLDDNKVSFLMWVPTAYRIIAQFNGLSKICPQYLRKLIFSGEAMPVSVYKYWRAYYPNATYIQLYGPTEITGACTSFNVIRDYDEDETIPIGKPFRNTGIILLDEDDKEITVDSIGKMGEICVFGTCLAAGYYNNPEKTDEVFVQNPLIKTHMSKMYRTGDLAKWDEEGNLVFVSRKDYQVKHSGKRIELGEIETAVQSVKEIEACCCVHNRERDALVLYYIGNVEGKEISSLVSSKLPKYMIPTIYHQKDELPTLPNGKLNRKIMDEWANVKK